jgi:HK97 family phage major capsid protein
MNDRIRNLQRKASELHQQASECLDKAEPSGEDTKKGLALIEQIKATKAEIETEFAAERGRNDLKSLKDARENPEQPFQWSGKAGDGFALGMKDAGRCLVDSFGTVLDDVGPGAIGDEQWKHISTPEYKRAFVQMFRKKGVNGLRGQELKTIQEGLDDQGGAFVPPDFLMKIVARKPTPTRVAGMCTNLTTGRDRVVMPRQAYSADDIYTTAFRATWTGEIPSSSSAEDVNDTGLTGNLEIPVFTAMLNASVTNDQVEDTGFPIMNWIEDQLRITYDLLRDNMVLTGSGKGQPQGINTSAGLSGGPAIVQTAGAAQVVADDLVGLSMLVPEQYEDGCSWVFNKTNTANYFRKLKDSQNRYLFGYGYQDSGLSVGRPKELAGYPFAYSGFMPNVSSSANPVPGASSATSGALPAIFGDFLGYYLINRLGLTIQVLRETRAKLNQIEILGRLRFGGKVAEPWRLKVLQVQ